MNALKSLPAALPVWLAVSAAAWADAVPGGGYGGGYGHHGQMWEGGWGGMAFGPLIGLLFIVAIAVAVVLVARAVGGGAGSRGDGKSALDILDERFARGEIDDKEYAARKQVLTGD